MNSRTSSPAAPPPGMGLPACGSRPAPSRGPYAARRAIRRGLVAVATILLAGCAVDGGREPVVLEARGPTQPGDLREVRQDTHVRLAPGSSGVVRKGTRWRRVGRIAAGEVYAPVDDAIAMEGLHRRAAYLVTTPDGRLAGLYLPLERTFSPLDPGAAPPLWEPSR